MEKEAVLREKGYECPCLVGKGSFAEVYRVREHSTGKHFACKISGNRGQLLREAQLLREVRHSLFPGFYDEWQADGRGYLVMEYIPGTSLEKLLRQRRGITENHALRIAVELAEGLTYLHERPCPILYRDLKPQNIQIREDGRIKLLDFGCACHIKSDCNVRVGTPGFAAPEQLAGKQADITGDIYAFGRLIQYMLSDGSFKRRGDSSSGAGASLLADLAEKCTRVEKEERLGSMRLCMYLLLNCREKTEGGRKRKSLNFSEKYIKDYVYIQNIWKKGGER